MDQSVCVFSGAFVINWEDYGGEVLPEQLDQVNDEIIEEIQKLVVFLYGLSAKYEITIRHEDKHGPSDITLGEQFSNLNTYLKLVSELIEYCQKRQLPWWIGDKKFLLEDHSTGFIKFNQKKQQITALYINDFNELVKHKVPMKGIIKLM